MQNRLQLYHKVLGQICQWLPSERITRNRNLALLVVGIYMSASVHLSLIVRKWPLKGKAPSLVNRLQRFLDNIRLSPHRCYEPLAGQLLKRFAGKRLRLVIDITKVGINHRALVVGLAYRKRTLPLAWSVHKGSIGNVGVTDITAVLGRVYRLIPSNCTVEISGDCGFKSIDLLRWLRRREWRFVIRQPGDTMVRLPSGNWVYLRDLPLEEGQTCSIGWVYVAKTNPFGLVWLLLHWAEGEEEPWYLVSDLASKQPRLTIRAYKRRMWIEEMFGDMKGHGFDLEATHLRDAKRIERLMLGVCITYVWFITLGAWVVKNGHRHLIDHKSRRDKSYFRLGWDWIERCINLEMPVRLQFTPIF